MSGGSFNYLHQRDLNRDAWEVRGMAKALRDMGHEVAAKRTEDVADARGPADSIRAELADVWHAVEWVHSGDYAWGDEADAIAEWTAKQSAKTAPPDDDA